MVIAFAASFPVPRWDAAPASAGSLATTRWFSFPAARLALAWTLDCWVPSVPSCPSAILGNATKAAITTVMSNRFMTAPLLGRLLQRPGTMPMSMCSSRWQCIAHPPDSPGVIASESRSAGLTLIVCLRG